MIFYLGEFLPGLFCFLVEAAGIFETFLDVGFELGPLLGQTVHPFEDFLLELPFRKNGGGDSEANPSADRIEPKCQCGKKAEAG